MAHISDIAAQRPMSFGNQLSLTARLAFPSMMAMVAHILMEYIDAAMVGHISARASAAVGVVATTQWLMWGICASSMRGFSVQISHSIGANDMRGARNIVRQSLVVAVIIGLTVSFGGWLVADTLPRWLRADSTIWELSSDYFRIFALCMPLVAMNFLAVGALRAAGNMTIAAVMNIVLCLLDVVFNYIFIYELNFGVAGAACGTVTAEFIVVIFALGYLLVINKQLRLFGHENENNRWTHFVPVKQMLRKWSKITSPLIMEHTVICGAHIMTTAIVAPLGIVAIAAHSFGISAESLCYMPGYGIAEAATTLVGQSYGARRHELMYRFAYIAVGLGMAVMAVMGVVMWMFAPQMMYALTPEAGIQHLGVSILRIEAWAEPLFGAAIVTYGAFVGAAYTTVPVAINFTSVWLVRLTLSAILAPTMGLTGVWFAMAIELSLRGLVFIVLLATRFKKIEHKSRIS